MPLMGGDEATITLRENGYADPIIAFTAHTMDGDRQKFMSYGFDDYTTEPIDAVKLIDTIYQNWGGPDASLKR